MRKVTLTYGLLAGAIISIIMVLSIALFHWQTGVVNFDNAELIGYGSMVIALSMIFSYGIA